MGAFTDPCFLPFFHLAVWICIIGAQAAAAAAVKCRVASEAPVVAGCRAAVPGAGL